MRRLEVDEELFTVPEFAARLKVKESTIRKWLLLGKLAFKKINNSLVRIPASELTRLLGE